MSEQIIRTTGVELCVQAFGAPADPAVLLIHGACASMLWWPEELCRRLADRGHHVIRFDNRDTGRSTSYPPGEPGYALSDMAADAVGILDALGVDRAHVVGRSMAAATALVLALDHPDRVATLTLVTATTGDEELPPSSPEFIARPTSTDPVTDVVHLMRAYAGDSPFFDERTVHELAERDVARTRSWASAMTNHFAMEFDAPTAGGPADVRVPTLVLHGELDPVYPLPHGEALAAAIPGAELVVLAGTGHDVPPQRYDQVVDALERHVRRWPPPTRTVGRQRDQVSSRW
ncbi:alpha/beta fold hydrolase [Pseudonocardia lacus]|uniref:alpha/beta fold hydrolase n=1 Tax=Pseudonocardia lacus TaxID=2835865 RepID=UPI001BDCA072|nr:alpha/beta hydrolase [Pseudonocardia lacus]